jgi:hypothetical protein
MAVCSGTAFADILRSALKRTPEEVIRHRAAFDKQIAEQGAAERAKYEAMTSAERRAYDDETFGMMPHLPGAAEHWARRR